MGTVFNVSSPRGVNEAVATRRRTSHLMLLLISVPLTVLVPATADDLADLAKPHDGRSMRAPPSHRIGPDGEYDPSGELDADSNRDNQSVLPGETKVLMEAQGPGVITHMWITFLGPGPHGWAKDGSANHQEMLLRIYYDGDDRPGVEAPVGDFFANCFGERREIGGAGGAPASEHHGRAADFYERSHRSSKRPSPRKRRDSRVGVALLPRKGKAGVERVRAAEELRRLAVAAGGVAQLAQHVQRARLGGGVRQVHANQGLRSLELALGLRVLGTPGLARWARPRRRARRR